MKNGVRFKETIGDLLIAMLLSGRSSYQFRKIIREREFARYQEKSVQVALSRLKRSGYLKNSLSGEWTLTSKGRLYANKNTLYSYIPSPFNKDSKHGTIVSFDIPGPQRAVRDWLRNQIKIFGYTMLQQSLWLGPGPLPKEFLKRLRDLKIRENVKIFSVTKRNS